MNVIKEEAKVIAVESTNGTMCKLTLATTIGRLASPGQFIMLQPRQSTSILRRPFSIYSFSADRLVLRFQIVGPNTKHYSQLQPGDQIGITGPCGQPVNYNREAQLFILIGGGCGLVALYALACELKGVGKTIMTLAGFQNKKSAFGILDFHPLSTRLEVATDDGSYGIRGTAVDLLATILSDEYVADHGMPPSEIIQVITCGPVPMLKLVAAMAKQKQMSCLVSLEEMMGCGVGDCLGCAVPTTAGMKHVCVDGPFFNASEVYDHE